MSIEVTDVNAPCGAWVTGIDLTRPLDPATIAAIRAAWLQHQVLAFSDPPMSVGDLERFATTIGPCGPDPYFESIPGHPHVAQVEREADEATSIFADTWHSDWSFLAQPAAATLLFGDIIPPVGGDTLFANQYDAWDALSPSMRTRLQRLQGVHSARRGYARSGRYGEADKGRPMAIRYDDSALATQLHPVARVHPETGRTAPFVSPGYTLGIEGLPDQEAQDLLLELYAHQGRDEFVHCHRWQAGMLVMWDNRCLVHAATGGYQGHRPDREGDVAVISRENTCIGGSAKNHDLSGLKGHRLRTHGGVSEAKVPFILSRPLNDAYKAKAAGVALRSYQIFDYAINGTV